MPNTLKRDIAVLQEQVREIKDNHLPHLQNKLEEVYAKLDRIVWLLVTVLGGLAVNIFYLYLKK